MEMSQKIIKPAMLCGILGCLCFGAGDWLMMYGDTTCHGSLTWLTEGVAQIPAWRNSLAMLLAFPGILFYGVALFSVTVLIRSPKGKTRYQALTTLGLSPWLCIHILYVMLLFAFAWMNQNDFIEAALPASEALFSQYVPVVVVGEILMVLPFLYWFWLVATNKTALPRSAAISKPLTIYLLLKLLTSLMPDTPFRLGFTTGLMSESMVIWFLILLILQKKISI